MTRSRNTPLIAGTGVLAVLALVATYFFLVAPKRAEAAEIATQTVQAAQQNEQLQQQTDLLASQFATLDERKAELAEIRATLPAEADVQGLLRQVAAYAASDGVSLLSTTVGTPVLHGGSATDTTTTGPVVVDVPVTLGIDGAFAATQLFVKQVQADMGRFLLLNAVSLGAGATGPDTVATTLTGTVYVVRYATTTTTSAGTASTTGSES